MNWQTIVVILLLLLSATVATGLAIYAWRQSGTGGARPFALMTAALAEWSIFYALELGAKDLPGKTLWAQFQYIGISLTPVGWFLFAFLYSGRDKWSSNSRALALIIIPATTVLLAFTNASHNLLWTQIALNSDGPFAVFDASYGIAWWIYFAYSYSLMLVGSIVLLLALRRFPTAYRWQLILLLLSPILPWLGNALYVARLSPVPQLDLAPFAFTLSAVILSLGIFRFHLFTIAPVARSAVIDSLRAAMLVLDSQNRIVDVNPFARRLFNLTDDDPIGKPAAQILGRWSDTVDRYMHTLETEEEISVSVGDWQRHYNLQISPVYDGRQQLKGRVVILRDITRDKQAEEAMAMVQVKTEFLAKVGHELRTPLNAILGLAEMLDFGVYGSITEEQRGVAQQIIDRTQHLTKLVNDLLAQTRLEAGQFNLEMTDFAIADLIGRLRETMGITAKKKGLTLTTEITADVPATLHGDPTRLYQILVNLVDNAIKFTRLGRIHARIYCPDANHWAIEVADTGVGIPEALQPHIFDAFQQVHYTITRQEKGVGLGLAIVKQLTTLMGGEITLTSQEGQGSVITAILPFEPVLEETA